MDFNNIANKLGLTKVSGRPSFSILYSSPQSGLTLVELAMVLVVIGTILIMAYGGWSVLVEGRRIAAAKNILNSANSCLWNYMLITKRVPIAQYFDAECSMPDPWNQGLTYLTEAGGEDVNCTIATSNTKSLKDQDGDIHSSIVWVVVSAGPNGQMDYTDDGDTWDFSQGDDIYVYVTDMQIHQGVCQ